MRVLYKYCNIWFLNVKSKQLPLSLYKKCGRDQMSSSYQLNVPYSLLSYVKEQIDQIQKEYDTLISINKNTLFLNGSSEKIQIVLERIQEIMRHYSDSVPCLYNLCIQMFPINNQAVNQQNLVSLFPSVCFSYMFRKSYLKCYLTSSLH